MATFYVHCRVSGGVTGTREALLKANGILQSFPTHEAAQAKARHLMREMNGPYATANFSYRAVSAAMAALIDPSAVDVSDPEACPGCGCLPGDGITKGCSHPDGCGYWEEN